MAKKVAVVLFSGSVDKLTGLAVLVGGAAAQDMEVDIFLQLWGSYAFRKDVVEENANFSEFSELKPQVHKALVELKAPSWLDLLKQAREAAPVRIHLCSLAFQIWGGNKEDFLDIVDDVIGAGEFMDMAEKADATFFV